MIWSHGYPPVVKHRSAIPSERSQAEVQKALLKSGEHDRGVLEGSRMSFFFIMCKVVNHHPL